jgi:hypothetical protein
MSVTPVIKKRGRGRSVTSVCPKSNIFDTSSNSREKIFIETVKGQCIPSLPNGPGDGGVDSSVFVGAAVQEPKIVKGVEVHVVEALVEMAPDLPGAGAEQKEVIHVFIQRTGEAGGRVGKVVPEAPLIGWKTLSPSKPAEDLALKGGSTPPNSGRHIIDLQMAESRGIEVFV